MDTLKQTVKQIMSTYAVQGLNGYSDLTHNANHTVFSIVSMAMVKGERHTMVSLITRIEGDSVIIEHDVNNKPLVDALEQAGIPRSQIILAYAGERVPESA